eukprot:TRINITY_DN13888_c0_g1_i1.p1 TRINITY_DN13888_c0_g1~~TRINITY_DN13888_c0_g1_i1.p1  ORF type:complete len:238 (+),score=68.42 TRINITY_DN13888_c0_g1_i1:30-716(+)
MAQRWLPLEANPEVFTNFLRKMGVPEQWRINDVFGLDEELLGMLPKPVLALMLLFPISDNYSKYAEELMTGMEGVEISDKVFYMKQTISNACGTVALLHSVLNNREDIILKDGVLKNFFDVSENKNAEEKAEMLEGDDSICEVHDDAAKDGQTNAPNLEDSVDYHFVTFVRVDGHLYELDGRKPGPVKMSPCDKDSFLSLAAIACKEYMTRDPENINFTVLALTGDMM